MSNNSLVLKIQFGKSSSQNYDIAVDRIAKFDTHMLISKGAKINSATFKDEEIRKNYRKIENLMQLVGNWKTTEMYLNDNLMENYALYQFKEILDCNSKYETSINPEEHCYNYDEEIGWSCNQLNAIITKLPTANFYRSDRYTYWYKYGSFISETEWKIDKDKIKIVLDKEIEKNKLEYCTVFRKENVYKIINNLPDIINTKDSDDWEILYKNVADGNIIEKKPHRIEPIIKRTSRTLDLYGENEDDSETSSDENRFVPEISFNDIGGIDDIIEVIREIIELPLKRPDIFEHMGIKAHKGILLYGYPGCGKTLVAKAIANEINAHFISIKGPELISKWHGQSEANLRSIFDEAREHQPTIIYFDEIDSIAQSRSGEESLRVDARFVNQMLTLMDGIEEYGNVCVIASTNRPELIDSALKRPGRFDYQIEIKKPTDEGCLQIFSIQTKNMPLSKNMDIKIFSKNLIGLSGAEIAFVAHEGAYNCLRRKLNISSIVEHDDFDNINIKRFVVIEKDFNKALKQLKINSNGYS